jgi:hypothetical protein
MVFERISARLVDSSYVSAEQRRASSKLKQQSRRL